MNTTINNRLNASIKHLIWKISPNWFHRRFAYFGQVFAIGIYAGETPFSISHGRGRLNPVITAADVKDIPAAFVADPFLIKKDAQWYMFFEVFNQLRRCGEIGVATSDDALTWQYKKIVLKTPFHLSYPQVFQWNSKFYMIPESSRKGVDLYESRQFPYRWTYKKTLLDIKGLVDSTIFFSDETWWMFTSHLGNGPHDQRLYLYYADEPTGNWVGHPKNPIKVPKQNLIRCGGRIIRYKNQLIRFAQNNLPEYGTDVRAIAVKTLSRQDYREEELYANPVLCGSDQQWNRGGMHHIDAHRTEDGTWMAGVDGWHFHRRPNLAGRQATHLGDSNSRKA